METMITKETSYKEMIDKILEESDRLYSLQELKEKYQLTFPFKAYRAAHSFKGRVITIRGLVQKGDIFPIKCCHCGSMVMATGDCFYSLLVVCENCDDGIMDDPREVLYRPHRKAWKLV